MRSLLVVLGFFLLMAGIFFPQLSKVWHFLDSLPGNIRIERPGMHFYFL
jgi:hypothetical protein